MKMTDFFLNILYVLDHIEELHCFSIRVPQVIKSFKGERKARHNRCSVLHFDSSSCLNMTKLVELIKFIAKQDTNLHLNLKKKLKWLTKLRYTFIAKHFCALFYGAPGRIST